MPLFSILLLWNPYDIPNVCYSDLNFRDNTQGFLYSNTSYNIFTKHKHLRPRNFCYNRIADSFSQTGSNVLDIDNESNLALWWQMLSAKMEKPTITWRFLTQLETYTNSYIKIKKTMPRNNQAMQPSKSHLHVSKQQWLNKLKSIILHKAEIYLHDLTHSIFHIGSKSKCNIWRQVVNPNALCNDLNGLLGHNTHFSSLQYLSHYSSTSTIHPKPFL